MKKTIIYTSILSLLLLGGCRKYEDAGFLDGPTVEDLLQDPSLEDLVLLTKGVEAQARVDMNMYVDLLGILGREAYDLNESDPRYTGELLGKDGTPLDNGGFLVTRSYAARYRTVKQANNALLGLGNSTATIGTESRNGFSGFLNTMKAHEFLLNLNMQYTNGIRTDVEDPANLGPFLGLTQSLQSIMNLLNTANNQLLNAGDEFPFVLGSGFADVSTPSGFSEFNRALASRVALYQGDNATALEMLDASFLDLNGSMNTGAYLSFNAADGSGNPLYHTDQFMAHPSFTNDATANDSRLSKVQATDAVTADGLTSEFTASIYSDPSDNVSMVRNEELILIFAEANVGTNLTNTLNAINAVRNAAGIGDFTGGGSEQELLDEIRYQRRYSLFGEAHRWVDMRRWGLLGQLPTDRPGDVVHELFPRPFGE